MTEEAPPIWGTKPAPVLVVCSPLRSYISDRCYPHLVAANVQAALDWGLLTHGKGVFDVVTQPKAHVADARCKLVKGMLERDADLVLWLDDDMAPPPSLFANLFRTLWQLRNAGIKVGAVSAVCRRVTPPWETCVARQGVWLEPDPDGPEYLQIDCAGFGAILTTGEALRAVHEETGGRSFELRPGKGEDAWWCEYAQKLGFKIYAKMNCFVGHKDDHIVDEEFVKDRRREEFNESRLQ